MHLVGLGLEPRDHASVESLVALSGCARVHHAGLDAAARGLLARFCRRGALSPAPADAAAAARRVVADAAAGKETALVCLGHPFYAGTLGTKAVAECARRGVEWVSYGAVSPLGTALSSVGLTLGTSVWGLQSFEHRAFSDKRPDPNPTWPTVVYFLDRPDAESVAACAARLRELFDAEHPGAWCSGPRAGERATPASLGALGAKVGAAWVLHLPPRAEASTALGRTENHLMSGSGPSAPDWVK